MPYQNTSNILTKNKHMRTLHLLTLSLIFALFTCRSEVPPPDQDTDFGIYEVLDPGMLSNHARDQLQQLQVQIPDNLEDPFAGVASRNDRDWRDSLSAVDAGEGIRIAVTAAVLEDEAGNFAVVALRYPADIGLSDIREAKGEGNRVVIRLTMQGAKKWAEMTERNTGRRVAFLLDGKIYNMPLVAAQILSGEALITGLYADEAISIAGILNGETFP
jgi:hypothetical protein